MTCVEDIYPCFNPSDPTVKGKFSYARFALMYQFYYAPNILMPLLVGLFIDKFGLRPSMILLSFITMIGQLVFCLGSAFVTPIHHPVNPESHPTNFMITGRFIYGIGMVSMIFAQVAFVTDWFVGPNLNFALSMTSSLPYLGAVLNAILTPKLWDSANPDKSLLPQTGSYGMAFWLGFIFNIIGFINVLILCFIDKRAEKNLEKMKKAWVRISADKDATNVVVLEKPKF